MIFSVRALLVLPFLIPTPPIIYIFLPSERFGHAAADDEMLPRAPSPDVLSGRNSCLGLHVSFCYAT